PITDDSHIILVKQFRKPVEQNLLEIPAGKIEINEEPKETAFRELCEETGFVANKLEYLFEFYTSPGFSNEKMYLFVAKELVKREADPDDDEYIEVLKVKIEDSINMILRGEIVDSKTIIGILYAQQYLIGK